MEKLLESLGSQAIGFALLYWYIDRTLKNQIEEQKLDAQLEISEQEGRRQDVDKLCSKIDSLLDAIHALQVKDVQKTVSLQTAITETKEMYVHILNRLEDTNEKVVEIRTLVNICPNTQNQEES